jgi:hypothetical protein
MGSHFELRQTSGLLFLRAPTVNSAGVQPSAIVDSSKVKRSKPSDHHVLRASELDASDLVMIRRRDAVRYGRTKREKWIE